MAPISYPTDSLIVNYLQKCPVCNPIVITLNAIQPVESYLGNQTSQHVAKPFASHLGILKGAGTGNGRTGLDLPILLNNPNNDGTFKTIMIIEEAPLRNRSTPSLPNDATVGTPNALHEKQSNPDIYRRVFNYILRENFNIYITDTYKLWNSSAPKGKPLMSLNPNYQGLLYDEINFIQPMTIVAFGDEAKNALLGISKSHTIPPHITLPHPSQQTWNGAYSSRLFKSINIDDIENYILSQLRLNGIFANPHISV